MKMLSGVRNLSCLRRIQDEQAQRRPKRFAFLFHTAAGKASHAWQESVILQFDEKLHAEAQTGSENLRNLVQAAYDDLAKSLLAASQPVPAFSEVFGRVIKALTGGELMITKVNSEAQVAALLDDDGHPAVMKVSNAERKPATLSCVRHSSTLKRRRSSERRTSSSFSLTGLKTNAAGLFSA
ncbi:MAG TPA: hypothetical protein VK815_17855 [Candidatus Acidoferrales bacterium]|nr:hypothetical protein [Candidatus Acidoferrales bacterium]